MEDIGSRVGVQSYMGHGCEGEISGVHVCNHPAPVSPKWWRCSPRRGMCASYVCVSGCPLLSGGQIGPSVLGNG